MLHTGKSKRTKLQEAERYLSNYLGYLMMVGHTFNEYKMEKARAKVAAMEAAIKALTR